MYSLLVLSGTVFTLVTLMALHTGIWCWQRMKNSANLSVPIFLTSILCFVLFIVYCLNWCLIILWDMFGKDLNLSFNKYICVYPWCNDVIYVIGKLFMFLFFFARLYDIFRDSVFKVSRKKLIALGVCSLLIFSGICGDIIIDIFNRMNWSKDNNNNNNNTNNSNTIENLSDCTSFSILFSDADFTDYNSYLDLGVICIFVELVLSAILLRLLVSRLLKLYISQKVEGLRGAVNIVKIFDNSSNCKHKTANMEKQDLDLGHTTTGKRLVPNSNREKFVMDVASLQVSCKIDSICILFGVFLIYTLLKHAFANFDCNFVFECCFCNF